MPGCSSLSSPPPRCSDTARERRDPLTATATTTRAWLLIEHPGPWEFDALGGSGIDPDVVAALVAAGRPWPARTLLVRRPGRAGQRAGARRWAVLHTDSERLTGPGRETWGEWEADADLLAAVDALGFPGSGAPVTSPQLLVCAHGMHDTCCAIRGRPVAAELARHWPEQTWECSHVGGDRFAANLILAPTGVSLGGLNPASAVEAVREVHAGRMPLAHLRGFTALALPAQAAATAVLDRWPTLRAHNLSPGQVTGLGDERCEVEVRVRPDGSPEWSASVVLAARRAPAAHLTCRAPRPTSATTYVVESVHIRDSGH